MRQEAVRNQQGGIGGPAMGRRGLPLGWFPGVSLFGVGTAVLAAMVRQRTIRDSAAWLAPLA
jgi:hypothetical protein